MVPYYTYFAAAPTLAGWPNTDYTGAGILQPTAMPAGAIGYRLVSQGFRVHATGALLNRTGMLRVRMMRDNPPDTTRVINVRTYNTDHSFDYAMSSIKEPVSIVNRKIDAPLADTFVRPAATTPSSDYTAAAANGWGVVVIAVDGAQASTTAIEIEVISHYELVFGDAEPMQQMATRTNPPNTIVQQAVAAVQDKATAIMVGSAERVGNYLLNKAVQGVGTAVGGYLGGPAGAMAGHLLLGNVD